MTVRVGVCAFALVLAGAAGGRAAEPARVAITAPKPYQVVQRVGFDPATSPPAAGSADVPIQLEPVPHSREIAWDYRVVPLAGATGAATEWAKLTAAARIPANAAFAAWVPAID